MCSKKTCNQHRLPRTVFRLHEFVGAAEYLLLAKECSPGIDGWRNIAVSLIDRNLGPTIQELVSVALIRACAF